MLFPVKETIQRRKSVRTFDGTPLSAADREKLEQFIADVPNPFGVKLEFRMLNEQEHGVKSPVVVGSDLYIAAKAQMTEGYEVGYGYSFELLCLYAESLGIGTVMLAASINRGAFEPAMELAEGEGMPCATPVGYPADKRSLRDAAMRKGLKADKRLPFEELFFDGSFDKGLKAEDAGVFADALEMARWAPSAGNKQPWRAVVDGNTVHFFEHRSYGNTHFGDTQKVDMGIAFAHFDLTLQEEGKAGRFVQLDPGIDLPEGVEYIASYVLE